MSRRPSQQFSKFDRALRKFFLSAFVVLSFAAYALHERLTGQSAAATPTSTSSSMVQPTFGGATAVPIPTETPVLQSVNAPTVLTSASYKDGVYSGPQVDVYYGLVQVQATIQGGKIVGVDFLDYPSDRRTSQQINAIALPYLQQEAIQAQSAHVDIISGATLTSEGFIMSLQSALTSANR